MRAISLGGLPAPDEPTKPKDVLRVRAGRPLVDVTRTPSAEELEETRVYLRAVQDAFKFKLIDRKDIYKVPSYFFRNVVS